MTEQELEALKAKLLAIGVVMYSDGSMYNHSAALAEKENTALRADLAGVVAMVGRLPNG